MATEYPAVLKNGKIIIKPIIEKTKNGTTVKVPSLKTIAQKTKQIENGKRNLQPTESGSNE